MRTEDQAGAMSPGKHRPARVRDRNCGDCAPLFAIGKGQFSFAKWNKEHKGSDPCNPFKHHKSK